jgi:hypothetical protein
VRLIDRLRIWATPALLVVLAVVGLAYAQRAGVLSLAWFKDNKDALGGVGSVVNLVAVVVGSALAYFRFFRGRTLATRADLSIDVDIIDGPTENHLHSIVVSVSNKGTVTIWNPRPTIRVMARHVDGRVSEFAIDRWIDERYEAADSRGRVRGIGAIDSDETADFFTEHLFGADVWAVTYAVSLTCSTGDMWTKLRTVANDSRKSSSEIVKSDLGATRVSCDGRETDSVVHESEPVSWSRRLRDLFQHRRQR